jgi:hypothetical protein
VTARNEKALSRSGLVGGSDFWLGHGAEKYALWLVDLRTPGERALAWNRDTSYLLTFPSRLRKALRYTVYIHIGESN